MVAKMRQWLTNDTAIINSVHSRTQKSLVVGYAVCQTSSLEIGIQLAVEASLSGPGDLVQLMNASIDGANHRIFPCPFVRGA